MTSALPSFWRGEHHLKMADDSVRLELPASAVVSLQANEEAQERFDSGKTGRRPTVC